MIEKLIAVQLALKAPKNQYNSFGKYNYRNCEDILESVKPLLAEQGLLLTIFDEVVEVQGRFYVKATAKITDGTQCIENTAFARESEDKKGMDASQVTGATSSYARKYALNGLFLIDDVKDSDYSNGTDNHKADSKPTALERWSQLSARASNGGITNDELNAYVKQHCKASKPSELTDQDFTLLFEWVNGKRATS
ncbi:ERF family protein [Veillonella sp.]|uniref:ERF family protein n=1 Tax=Veillonella sp. TaxID=1926307 RepID=UPI0025E0BDEF|nr:ERF family protein [Veillonella sp.]